MAAWAYSTRGRAGPDLAPGKSRFSAMVPTMVFDGDRPTIVIGAPGGTQIVMGVMQAIVNMIDFEMPVLDAVVAPRFSATSDLIDVSNRIPAYVTDEVATRGYAVARSHLSYPFAGVHGLRLEGGEIEGAAAPHQDRTSTV